MIQNNFSDKRYLLFHGESESIIKNSIFHSRNSTSGRKNLLPVDVESQKYLNLKDHIISTMEL